MDRIILEGLQFYGYHGVYPPERVLGQRFVVDLVLGVDLRPAGESDNVDETVDYALVHGAVRDVVEGEPCALIEAVAERIARIVLERFAVAEVRVRVSKPSAAIAGAVFQRVAVEIVRPRHS